GEAGEGSRHLAVGNPAGGVDTRLQQGSPPGLGSRRAVDPGEEAQLADGTGEVLAQLQAVVVPPVANPYQVAGPVLDAARIEDAGVGGSVPRPGRSSPAVLQVEVADGGAAGQDAVVILQAVGGERRLVRDRAVMRVVEEQAIGAAVPAVVAKTVREDRVAPLVDDHEAGAFERAVEVEGRGIVALAGEPGVGGAET